MTEAKPCAPGPPYSQSVPRGAFYNTAAPLGFLIVLTPRALSQLKYAFYVFFFYCKQKFRVQQLCSCKSSLECLPSWNNDKNNNRWTYIKSEKLMWG